MICPQKACPMEALSTVHPGTRLLQYICPMIALNCTLQVGSYIVLVSKVFMYPPPPLPWHKQQ